MTQISPFRYFKTSPEIIRLAGMLYVRFPLSLRRYGPPKTIVIDKLKSYGAAMREVGLES